MSDYLNNLAAKSLHLTEVIQPRLASLFEPPSLGGRPVSSHSSANVETAHGEQLPGGPLLETPLTAQASSRNVLTSRPPMRELRRPPGALQQQPGGVADSSAGQHTGQAVSPQPLPLSVPQSVETRPEQFLTHPVPNPAQRTLTPTLAPRSHLNPPTLVPLVAGYENDAAPSRNTGEQESQSAGAQNIRGNMERQIAVLEVPRSQNSKPPELVPIQARQFSTPARVVAPRHGVPRIEPAASARAEPGETQEPAPTIQVTIGRVEIRATVAATPAGKTSAKSPVMSLDEYLRQRNGGRG